MTRGHVCESHAVARIRRERVRGWAQRRRAGPTAAELGRGSRGRQSGPPAEVGCSWLWQMLVQPGRHPSPPGQPRREAPRLLSHAPNHSANHFSFIQQKTVPQTSAGNTKGGHVEAARWQNTDFIFHRARGISHGSLVRKPAGPPQGLWQLDWQHPLWGRGARTTRGTPLACWTLILFSWARGRRWGFSVWNLPAAA